MRWSPRQEAAIKKWRWRCSAEVARISSHLATKSPTTPFASVSSPPMTLSIRLRWMARNKDGTWSFDTAAGRQEILARRIGHNELDAVQTSLAYVDAQNEYAAKDRGDGQGVYAGRFISESGKKDGLYWPTAQGEEESPLGELFAAASRQGYRAGEGRSPYHGYYYKILTKQGPAATGGAVDYVVNGKMIGGFALVAYPAAYRNSGVMTFIVNHEGVVFQKDLGPRTAELAERMTAFNPDSSWTKVTDTEPVR
jgi:hypothetical protein